MSTEQPSLPPILDLLNATCTRGNVTDSTQFSNALALLFEASPVLFNALVPQLQRQLHTCDSSGWPKSYGDLVDSALVVVRGWTWDEQAAFVGGHPRIGEVKGLSALSATEQGQTSTQSNTNTAISPTPPEVLVRLAFLNTCYERRYPGLVYITFVNGRSRTQIKKEMECKFVEDGMFSSVDWEGRVEDIVPRAVPSNPWIAEVKRAVDDVGKIAKSRLSKLGHE